MAEKFPDDQLQVVTIHSPEFAWEKSRENLVERLEHFGLEYPVYIDNDLGYFSALKARGWPTFYLVDKAGFVRHVYLGETHAGFAQARSIETRIRALIREKVYESSGDL